MGLIPKDKIFFEPLTLFAQLDIPESGKSVTNNPAGFPSYFSSLSWPQGVTRVCLHWQRGQQSAGFSHFPKLLSLFLSPEDRLRTIKMALKKSMASSNCFSKDIFLIVL